MAAVTTKETVQWGTNQKTGASSFGILVSYEEVEDAMTQTETDENGAVCRVVLYDLRKRVVIGVQAKGSATLPKTGETMTINGITGWIQHAELVEQNKAFKKIRITLEMYKNCHEISKTS